MNGLVPPEAMTDTRAVRIALAVLVMGCAGLGTHEVTSVAVTGEAKRTWAEIFAHPTALTVEKRLSGWVKAGPSILIDVSNPLTPAELKKDLWVPSPVYIVRHPAHGTLLFDTGVASGQCAYGQRPFFWVPCQSSPDGNSATQLKGEQLSTIVLSHAHGDHIGGLSALEATGPVPVLMSEAEWSAVSRSGRLFDGYLTEQVTGSYPVKVVRKSDFIDMPILGPVFDLFGDGSIWLIDARGHTEGELSVLLNAESGPVLLTFDASHLAASFELGIAPGFSVDKTAAVQTLQRLSAFKKAYPQLEVVYGHEPSQWAPRTETSADAGD